MSLTPCPAAAFAQQTYRNPIARRGNGVFGPGHHCATTAPDGRLWMVYQQKNGTEYGWKRFLGIDPLWYDDRGVIHTKTTRGTEQPAPALRPAPSRPRGATTGAEGG